MRWQDRRRSSNVEDRRGQNTGGGMFGGSPRSGGGGGFNFPMGGRMGGGIGLIIILVLALLFGGGDCLGGLFGGPQTEQAPGGPANDDSGVVVPTLGQSGNRTNPTYNMAVGEEVDISNDDMIVDFLKVVLAETEVTWTEIFKQYGRTYKPTTLVVYDGRTHSACGTGTAQTGPFYCPADQKVYIDVSFFRELAGKYRAGGDFAIAYVLAHEVAHHVQYLLGITQQMEQQRGRVSQTEMNRLTVRLELQADYMAGVWAHDAYKQGIISEGDLEEAMRATAAIGDDRLQKQAQGYVVPDSFTHGTSEQRTRWFLKGYETGSLAEWDTFSIPYDQLMAPQYLLAVEHADNVIR
ncbi:MAG TPA: hypothetical protein GXZ89_04905 [Fastidiosipila sp.]|jgi:predicted metalloprotease|nr:hypothetical protein [Fastidiosipila sp.]